MKVPLGIVIWSNKMSDKTIDERNSVLNSRHRITKLWSFALQIPPRLHYVLYSLTIRSVHNTSPLYPTFVSVIVFCTNVLPKHLHSVFAYAFTCKSYIMLFLIIFRLHVTLTLHQSSNHKATILSLIDAHYVIDAHLLCRCETIHENIFKEWCKNATEKMLQLLAKMAPRLMLFENKWKSNQQSIIDVLLFMLVMFMSKNCSCLVSMSDDLDENVKRSSNVDSRVWHRRYFIRFWVVK